MKYCCIKQHDITDCGAACLATISKQYGLNLSISKIREVASTDKQGTIAYGVVKAAEQLGFTAVVDGGVIGWIILGECALVGGSGLGYALDL